MEKQIHYFKRPQLPGIYMYFEVHGGPGKNATGFQIVINFNNKIPLIDVEHNIKGSLTGTWCQFEVGEPISKEEYQEAWSRATSETCNFGYLNR